MGDEKLCFTIFPWTMITANVWLKKKRDANSEYNQIELGILSIHRTNNASVA